MTVSIENNGALIEMTESRQGGDERVLVHGLVDEWRRRGQVPWCMTVSDGKRGVEISLVRESGVMSMLSELPNRPRNIRLMPRLERAWQRSMARLDYCHTLRDVAKVLKVEEVQLKPVVMENEMGGRKSRGPPSRLQRRLVACALVVTMLAGCASTEQPTATSTEIAISITPVKPPEPRPTGGPTSPLEIPDNVGPPVPTEIAVTPTATPEVGAAGGDYPDWLELDEDGYSGVADIAEQQAKIKAWLALNPTNEDGEPWFVPGSEDLTWGFLADLNVDGIGPCDVKVVLIHIGLEGFEVTGGEGTIIVFATDGSPISMSPSGVDDKGRAWIVGYDGKQLVIVRKQVDGGDILMFLDEDAGLWIPIEVGVDNWRNANEVWQEMGIPGGVRFNEETRRIEAVGNEGDGQEVTYRWDLEEGWQEVGVEVDKTKEPVVEVSGTFMKENLEETIAWFMDSETEVDPLLGLREGSRSTGMNHVTSKYYALTLGVRDVRIVVGEEEHIVRTVVMGYWDHKKDERIVREVPTAVVDRSLDVDMFGVIPVLEKDVELFMDKRIDLPFFAPRHMCFVDEYDLVGLVGQGAIYDVLVRVHSSGLSTKSVRFGGIEVLARTIDGVVAESMQEFGVIEYTDFGPIPVVSAVYPVVDD